MRRTTHIKRPHPRGFSLIEMLIVMGILAALVALSLVALNTSQNAANIAATRATIAKVDALLRDQFAGFDKTSGHLTSAADIESMKANAKTGFPQRDVDVTFPWTAGNDIYDSSELLYLILTEGRVAGSTPVDADSFNGSELADTDGDGLLELVDAWGNPLRYYRWPTRLLNPFRVLETTVESASPVGVGDATITLTDQAVFDTVLSTIQNTSNGGDANATLFAVIGDEIIEVDGAGFSIKQRGAAGTSAEAHHAGAPVRLAPFPQLVSLLMGSLTVGAATHDPDDPRGSLPPAIDDSVIPYTRAGFEDEYHTLDSYHTPLIISAGPDGILGLLEPFEPFGTSPDDYNRGYLAMPDTNNGADLSTIVNPGSTALGDNLTNVGGGN